jgi:hypothetical protein
MQPIADELETALPNESQENLERCLKHAILILRHSAMAMLLNDENYVQHRLLTWIEKTAKAFNTQPIDRLLYPMLDRQLGQVLTPAQINLIKPPLTLAQNALLKPASV